MTKAIRMRRAAATLLLTAFLSFPVALATAPTATSYTYVPSKLCPIDWHQGTWRESMFDPDAYNAYACARGIFQHLCRYWPGRAYDYGFKGWSAYNARANIIVTMKMVRKHGWSAWGG